MKTKPQTENDRAKFFATYAALFAGHPWKWADAGVREAWYRFVDRANMADLLEVLDRYEVKSENDRPGLAMLRQMYEGRPGRITPAPAPIPGRQRDARPATPQQVREMLRRAMPEYETAELFVTRKPGQSRWPALAEARENDERNNDD